MNNKSKRYKPYAILTFLIIGLALVLFLSGCLGTESKTNISIGAPEVVEALGYNVETLTIELIPTDADAKNVIVNLSAPSGISLTDPHTSLQQYSREIKRIQKGKKEIIFFNYSAFVGDEGDFILDVKADNANTTRRTIKVDLSVPAPKWEAGEYWVLNQTAGDFHGKHMQQFLRKESQDGKKVYVVKDILAKEINGTYRLYYYTAEGLEHIKTEYYEDDKIIEKMTETIDPPSLIYGFPLKVGKKWDWNGTISGIGRTEIKGEVLGKDKISVLGKSYDTYKIRLKYTFPLGTSVLELWYSPILKGVVKEKGSMNMGGLIKESETELMLHGAPPDKPPDIQSLLQQTENWKKTYIDADRGFSFKYPENWVVNTSLKSPIIVEDTKTREGVLIYIEPTGKMSLEEYIKKIRSQLVILGNINYEENIDVNGVKGYKYYLQIPPNAYNYLNVAVFVANENGYMIVYAYQAYYSSPFYYDIVNSFVFKRPPVYTLLERK